jgi:hypothetical protein
MNYDSPAAFRMALEARLLQRARSLSLDLNRLRRGVVFERLLVRLERAEPGVWVLKGGMALEVRWQLRARSTRDLDLDLRAHLADGTAVRLALAVPLASDPDGDWFQFVVGEARALTALEAGRAGWRFPVAAALAGRSFAEVKIDVVLRRQEISPTERLRLPGALDFAGIATADVDVMDRRQHFAEKLHALTRSYADGPSSRVKDLADLVLLIDDGLEPAGALLAITQRLYDARASHALPVELPDPPSDWAARYAELAADLDVSAKSLSEAMRTLRVFWATTRSHED